MGVRGDQEHQNGIYETIICFWNINWSNNGSWTKIFLQKYEFVMSAFHLIFKNLHYFRDTLVYESTKCLLSLSTAVRLKHPGRCSGLPSLSVSSRSWLPPFPSASSRSFHLESELASQGRLTAGFCVCLFSERFSATSIRSISFIHLLLLGLYLFSLDRGLECTSFSQRQ